MRETKVRSSKTKPGNNNFNKMLDDYEDYIDEYLKLYKNAMKGDTEAISEYTSLMQKAG